VLAVPSPYGMNLTSAAIVVVYIVAFMSEGCTLIISYIIMSMSIRNLQKLVQP
jgi:phage shock protein PspC (stress-responsive transcriptional regulator)